MKKTKTNRELFNELPEPQRTQAIKNTLKLNYRGGKNYLRQKRRSVLEAIHGAFTWAESPEGHEYWSAINNLVAKESAD